jgi:glyoxylase-like metal-dependent hydrolase (beta-lactamase superfamily II)
MKRLTECIWYTEPSADTDRPVLAIVRGSKRTLMVDGGNSPKHAQAFLDELDQVGLAQADFIATTHSHCDHIFGLSRLKGIVLSNSLTNDRITMLNELCWDDKDVAERVKSGQEHEMTALMLKYEMPGDRSHFRIRQPDVVYETRLKVDLGKMVCYLERIGGDHAPDSTIVHIPEQGLAFIGDCLYLRSWDRSTVDDLFGRLLGFGAEIYVDSHEGQPITRKQLEKRYKDAKTIEP